MTLTRTATATTRSGPPGVVDREPYGVTARRRGTMNATPAGVAFIVVGSWRSAVLTDELSAAPDRSLGTRHELASCCVNRTG